ncbi:MAG TPA: hydroxyacylglutathione hydrolase [Pseudomonadota bacterium]|nr:hydroxyacylglutathione hydrolase [Pseudomonadota bacterium]HNK43430.1 hydroxyacylglutathione hydrolase [Pseudomonadota bacterium]HNN49720.1 hydroxyacylglutathione hydrolase [Pseudomonadota bacterium]
MITVELVPCYSDNYAYLLSHPDSADVVVVDACEYAPIAAALGGRRLSAILSTHHHLDHVGGNEEFAAQFPGLPILGHSQELVDGRIPRQTAGLADGESFSLLGSRVVALHVPGHTLTAVAYHFTDEGIVFTGDTLFGAGCGRLFEGTPVQMHASLSRLAALTPSTKVYSGHEYLARNLGFARSVDPGNQATQDREQDCQTRRARHEPTEPSSIALERSTNPFLRTSEPAVQAAVQSRPVETEDALSAVEVFARLRRWRNTF